MANKLEVGFSRVVITPPLGTNIRGYFHQRLAEGVYDDLEVNAIAIKVEDNTAILLTVDCEDCEKEYKLTLKDFENKLDKALYDKDARFNLGNWLTDDYDYYDCNNLLQYIMFGEIVYG
jgi:hypothetical protein